MQIKKLYKTAAEITFDLEFFAAKVRKKSYVFYRLFTAEMNYTFHILRETPIL